VSDITRKRGKAPSLPSIPPSAAFDHALASEKEEELRLGTDAGICLGRREGGREGCECFGSLDGREGGDERAIFPYPPSLLQQVVDRVLVFEKGGG